MEEFFFFDISVLRFCAQHRSQIQAQILGRGRNSDVEEFFFLCSDLCSDFGLRILGWAQG